MSRIKTHVRVGDTAEVISGNFKGKTGTVLKVNIEKKQVVLEGVRVLKKAVKRSEQDPQGGIQELDGPIALSNVKKVG